VKLILGQGQTLKGRLVLYDAMSMKFRELKLRRDPACAGACSRIKGLIDYHEFCGMPNPHRDELDPHEVKAKIDRGDQFVFVDVREVQEYQTAQIKGTRLIPLGELPDRLSELDRSAEIVLHCKGGVRSAKALALLKENGFTNAKHMKGGILAWSDQVDPAVPKY
jgi:adenylyltransferase/sulfurtransferase